VDLKCRIFKFSSNIFSCYSSNKGKWKLFLDFFLAKYNANLLITGNLNVTDVASLEIDDPFAKGLIEIWLCLFWNGIKHWMSKIRPMMFSLSNPL